jgi:low affinity Fe/Cu permease
VSSNTQSYTRTALQLKFDELIRSTSGAHNVMLKLEEMTLEEIETFCTHYEKLAVTAREKLRRGHHWGTILSRVEVDSLPDLCDHHGLQFSPQISSGTIQSLDSC